MRSRSFTYQDLYVAKNYERTSAPRARSAEAVRRPMLSGREEPEQMDLLRPIALRDFPAHGAAGARGSTDAWSEIANASDPDPEPEDSLDTSPLPVPAKSIKKRVVFRGNEPRSEASCTRRPVYSDLRPYTFD